MIISSWCVLNYSCTVAILSFPNTYRKDKYICASFKYVASYYDDMCEINIPKQKCWGNLWFFLQLTRSVYTCWKTGGDQHYCFKSGFPLEGAHILEMLMWWKPNQMKSSKKKANQSRDWNETARCFLHRVAYYMD